MIPSASSVTYSLDSTGTPSVTITPQAPGSAPQGPTGPQGPIGPTGASGATGPPGAGTVRASRRDRARRLQARPQQREQQAQGWSAVQDQAGQPTDQVHDHCLGPRVAFARRRRLRNRHGSDGAWAHNSCSYGLASGSAPRVTRDPQATGGTQADYEPSGGHDRPNATAARGSRLCVHRADCSSACTPGGKCQTRPQSRPIRQSDCSLRVGR